MQNTNSTAEQQQEFSNIVLIDGDPIPFLIGWNHREHTDVQLCLQAVDIWMQDFLTLVGPQAYLLVISNDNPEYFRKVVYKMKPYKGNRKDQEEWVTFWEPIIRKHLTDKWKAVHAPKSIETDDVLSMMHNYFAEQGKDVCIASPDKDMRQVAGKHIDFRKLGTENFKGIETVSAQQANRNFWMQVLMGDDTDNVAGIPGIGEKKAAVILDNAEEMMWPSTVQFQYQKYFGDYYGDIIFLETKMTLQLIGKDHDWDGSKFMNDYKSDLVKYAVIL